MRVLAVCSDSALHVSSKETAKKGRNLAADGRCVITTDAGAYQTGETKGRGRPPRVCLTDRRACVSFCA
jgi:hypothetical protein